MNDTLQELDIKLHNKRPEYALQLQPGLSIDEISNLEQRFDVSLPADLKQLYMWHNGQSGSNFEAFVNNAMFISLEQALDTANENNTMIGEDFESADWWHKGWIPLFHNGSGDYVCYDTIGSFNSAKGQIIEFWHAANDRSFISSSLKAFLDSLNSLYDTITIGEEYFIVDSSKDYPITHFA